MSAMSIHGLCRPGCSAVRGGRGPRSWAGRLLTVAASAAIAGGLIVPAAAAVPGDLAYAGCYGDLAGCTPAYPPLLKWGVDLYVYASAPLAANVRFCALRVLP